MVGRLPIAGHQRARSPERLSRARLPRFVPKRCVISEESDQIVGSLGRELVSDLAPEEPPLYPSLLSRFQGAKDGCGTKLSDDQVPGFGAPEALRMLTSLILSITRSFCQDLAAEAAKSSAHGVLEYLKAHLPGHHGAAPTRTTDQLQLVRMVAGPKARRLDISVGQAGLLADAMVGVLAAPQTSASIARCGAC